MDNKELCIEEQMPAGVLTSISFNILTEKEAETTAVKVIGRVNEVTDPALGNPNYTSQCATCGAKDNRDCEGHLGVIRFPYTILHPYFMKEVAQILNKICPGCKSIRKNKAKKNESVPPNQMNCRYCDRNFREFYPPLKFKASTHDVFAKTAIVAEIKGSRRMSSNKDLPRDYWDFVPNDQPQEDTPGTSNKKVLSHAQVYHILKDLDPSFLEGYLSKRKWIFLQCFPLTPNCHRITELGQQLIFDERNRAYKKLIDFRGSANDFSVCVLDCIKLSKFRAEKQSPTTTALTNESVSKMHGLKFVKEVSLGKRTDFCFRMVCVGDPFIRLDEIGVPCNIAESMHVCEQLNSLNWDKLSSGCDERILQRGETFVRRGNRLQTVRFFDKLHIGDTVYRPLSDGDIVLLNRPPSIHAHSLIALSVKILPINSVLSINPLICSPLRGDFDGDSLHGFIPQSLHCRMELRELVSLKSQLVDKQSGKNLLSLSHDSLTAVHLLLEKNVLLDRFQIQQLQMFCPRLSGIPAVVKAPLLSSNFNGRSSSCMWTGKQLFSLLLPRNFNFENLGAQIRKGELVASFNASSFLLENDDNIFHYLIKNYSGEEVLEFLHNSQGVLLEWLSMRGFSVSLSDLYLSSDSISRKNMTDDVLFGLREAERTAHANLLMVDSNEDFLSGKLEGNQSKDFDSEQMSYKQQESAALSRVSATAFKHVLKDIQNLIYHYSSKDNSFLSMLKAGSKGNLMKFVQHSMCLGYQHSLVPLSFHFPHRLSCVAWNNHKRYESDSSSYDRPCVDKYIPYGVIETSFVSGLNPVELFVHSVTNRDASFGGHADISGTLHRKLMFFMRDLYFGYDGTVRNSYGNQLVQFSYDLKNISDRNNSKSLMGAAVGGEPVGALAASALSEVAYGALDQPISALENSPLLNLKKVLECGVKKVGGEKTVSLFLSQNLKRWTNGFEYGALEVKNHLEKAQFRDVVSLVTIFYSSQTDKKSHPSPWICHFHISKEAANRKQLKPQSIINALLTNRNSSNLKRLKVSLPDLKITCNGCTDDDNEKQTHFNSVNRKGPKENNGMICITVQLAEGLTNSSKELHVLQDVVIPVLLDTVIKGSLSVKKVDILWKDSISKVKTGRGSSGELYLQVFMSENCDRKTFWRVLMDDCLQIFDMIDWNRSHPDDILDVALAQGIDAARSHFMSTLKAAVADTGKSILPQHLVLASDCLSSTGEFVPLNAKGLQRQRMQTSVSSPFSQACFSNPADCFIKAAKKGAVDNLEGAIDSLSWGKVPSLGTNGQFDIVYSGKGHEIAKPENIYSLLSRNMSASEEKERMSVPSEEIPRKTHAWPSWTHDNFALKGSKGRMEIVKAVLKKHFSAGNIQRLSQDLKHILRKYDINNPLNQEDKATALKALCFHPRADEKIGTGPFEIKVGYHPKHKESRCFLLERTDGTIEDFSYHKCVHNALEMISPSKAKTYHSRWLNGKEEKLTPSSDNIMEELTPSPDTMEEELS